MSHIDKTRLRPKIVRECERRGLKLKGLAREVSCSGRQITRAIAGQSPQTLRAIAKFFDMCPEELVAGCLVGEAAADLPSDAFSGALTKVAHKQLRQFVFRDAADPARRAVRLQSIYRRDCTFGSDSFFQIIAEGFEGRDKTLKDHETQADIDLLKRFVDGRGEQITIASCTWFVSACAIFAHLKEKFGVPIAMDFDFAHSGTTAIRCKMLADARMPDLTMVADGPSGFVFENFFREPRYIPAAFAPPCEHRIILHRESKLIDNRWNLHGEYHVVNHGQLLSTPRLHLESLIESRQLRGKRIAMRHVDPGGQLPIFLNGASETRSVFCDPQWDVIRLWHPDAFIVHSDPHGPEMWSDVLIHAEEKFFSTPACAALLRLFYRCGYDMKYGVPSNIVAVALNQLLDRTDYGRLLLQFCGLK
ncbi:MAG: helix-turn-helix transcriptional regulator [Steroidobacter sp.]